MTKYMVVTEIIRGKGIPMQTMDIYPGLKNKYPDITYSHVTTIICEMVKEERLYPFKYKGLPTFWAIPSFLIEGGDVYEPTLKNIHRLDPHTKTPINAIKDQPV